WIAVGPGVGDAGHESVYVAFLRQTSSAADLVITRSDDEGTTWTMPTRFGGIETVAGSMVQSNLNTITVGADGTVHVVYLGLGYSTCPNDASMPCGANERINDATFTFATSRDPMRWHGDYPGITLAPSGDVWATWSDTRTGTPQMFMSRGHLP